MRPDRVRHLVLGATLTLLVCAVIEAVSYLGILMVTTKSFSWDRMAEGKRIEVQTAAALKADSAAPTFIVPHPYLGFVYNPEHDPAGALRLHGLPVSSWGFLDDKTPVRPRSERAAVIGIFGGSVAFWFSGQGMPTLLEELSKIPALRGKELVVVRTALGGFKQPQQLMTLSYLLALGAHFDVVINLDGFNEVALSPRDTSGTAAFPFFPRDWGNMLGSAGDLNRLRLVGEITFLQAQRGDLAGVFLRPVLAQSITANLIWVLLDRREAGRIAAAQLRLARYQPAAGAAQSYAARGPAATFKSAAELETGLVRMWQRSSLQMAQMARANGIRYFHLLQPNQYLEGSKPMREAERKLALLPPGNAYEEAVRQGYPRLRVAGAELARQGVAFHDLTQAFAGVEQTLYNDNCCHFNAEGNLILGRIIGTIVRKEFENSAPR